MNPKILKGTAAIIILLVLGYFAGALSERTPKPAPVVISYGEADIGGAFRLVDTGGNVVTDQALLGKKALIYFGYTNCPDVCPLDMNRISMALDILEQDRPVLEVLQPVFISIDPAHDSPDQVARFLARYHPSFIGLTGTFEQMDQVAKAYKVAYEKMLAAEDKPLINHSSNIYLMDEEGKYITHFGSDVPPNDLAEVIAGHLD
jgi:protein SCO1/2